MKPTKKKTSAKAPAKKAGKGTAKGLTKQTERPGKTQFTKEQQQQAQEIRKKFKSDEDFQRFAAAFKSMEEARRQMEKFYNETTGLLDKFEKLHQRLELAELNPYLTEVVERIYIKYFSAIDYDRESGMMADSMSVLEKGHKVVLKTFQILAGKKKGDVMALVDDLAEYGEKVPKHVDYLLALKEKLAILVSEAEKEMNRELN
jgi:hypothetical protein